MDRCWLLTWTTYGTWLPGDSRGSAARTRENPEFRASRIRQNVYETPYVSEIPALASASSDRMKGASIRLDREQATIVARQIEESAIFRGWELFAASVMANHVHVVVGVPDDPSPSKLLQIVKSYASRALNERWPRPESGTWWTASGSTRKLADDEAVGAAVRYVREQQFILARCEPSTSKSSMVRPRGTSVPRSPGSARRLAQYTHDESDI